MSKALCSAMQGCSLADGRSFLGGSGGGVASRSASAPTRGCGFWVEAAHKKGAGSTKNGRDSISKRRGVKVFGMQKVKAGGIIIRQVGTKFHPGENVGVGRDYTIFAKEDGIVFFERGKKTRKLISVYPQDHPKIQSKLPKKEPREGPTRRERWLAQHTPRAIQREQAQQASDAKQSVA